MIHKNGITLSPQNVIDWYFFHSFVFEFVVDFPFLDG